MIASGTLDSGTACSIRHNATKETDCNISICKAAYRTTQDTPVFSLYVSASSSQKVLSCDGIVSVDGEDTMLQPEYLQ